MNKTARILVVDDDAAIRRMIRAALADSEFEVIEAGTCREGVRLTATNNPDLVILDLGLPDADGLSLVEEVRNWSHTPIIVLSARGEEQIKVKALDAGAQDYVSKPFSMPELLARMRVALRLKGTAGSDGAGSFECRSLKVNFQTREVFVDEKPVHLTPLEYKLLCLLTQNAGRVLTHKQILASVWGQAYTGQNHYVRVFMKALRHKIEKDPNRPELLLTESGVGYRLKAD